MHGRLCNNHGNHAAGDLWGATHVNHLTDLFAWIDVFSWQADGNLLYYLPYDKLLPAKQARLLECWNNLGIRHDEQKQE